MDPIRSLLLARTHTVVLDPDRVAMAATRPSRDADVDRFEDQLLQLGFVMSLDLAMTIRRLPNQTIQDLRNWMLETLGKTLGARRPQVPLARDFPDATPGDPTSLYLRRVSSWLLTCPNQPCPWCGEVKPVGALDPCGHLVCKTCWAGGSYAGCPICHRRIAPGDPFVQPPTSEHAADRVTHHDGDLRLIYLAFDVAGVARERFERLLARATPLSKDDRSEIETVIDTMGPKAATWLPKRIPIKETMAIALARLWIVAPDRSAMVRTTQGHLRTATDVLRVASVLMGADPSLVEPMRLRSVSRGLRRAVLEALERLAPGPLVVPGEAAGEMLEDMMRHQGLWKRVGERLHPFEYAAKLPAATLAFAAVRGTNVATSSFGQALTERIQAMPSVRITDSCVRVSPWAGPIEGALRAGDARAAAARLAERPAELLRRADHLVRVTCAKQPEALGEVLETVQRGMPRGAPGLLLTLAAHVAKREVAWPRRVVIPKGQVLRSWSMPDLRAPLRPDAIATIVLATRSELIARAESKRRFARAVIDRGLGDLVILGGRSVIAVGSHRASLAPLGKDFADLIETGAQPTMWDVACLHAAARANVIYIRERDGRIAMVRRRDGETTLARLARLHASEHDGELTAIPAANAPTWVAVLRDDLAIPAGSAGYVLDARTAGDQLTRLDAADLVADLAAKDPQSKRTLATTNATR